jgi:large subunit ribosomal protein L10
MKKLGILVKEISGDHIKNQLKESTALFIIRHSGLSSPDISSLRLSLKKSCAHLFVVKNSVARITFNNVGLKPLIKAIEGPCGLVFAKEEPVAPSRVLCNFSKVHEQLKLEGGYLKDRVLEKKDIEAMAKLPTKEVLRAQLVMTLNSPISGLAVTLNQLLAKFVYCLEQIRQKKVK